MPFRVVGYNKPIDDSSLQAMRQSVLDLVQWTTYELQQVASALVSTEADKVWNVAPPKPRQGTQAYADGTHWNPGAGEGFYEYTSVGWIPMFVDASSLSTTVRTVKVQRFTANGTYTPSPGMIYCIIECVGGGGAGGGASSVSASTAFAGGGGGSGGYSRGVQTAADIGVSKVVTIGVGGAGVSGGVGNSGGQTSVGTLVVANGGSGGQVGNSGTVGQGGPGGTAGTGNALASTGAPGTGGVYNLNWNTTTILNATGNGGSSIFGGGGSYVWGNIAGTAATGYGSGGSGATSAAAAGPFAGGAGSGGIVVITEFCNQ